MYNGLPEVSGDEMASQTEYAWAAGFFDGEGCVSISCTNRNRRHYQLMVQVAQKDIKPLEAWREIFQISTPIRETSRARHGVISYYHRLFFHGPEARRVLQLMLPYLRLKREVAEAGIEFQNSIEQFYSHRGRYSKLPDHVITSREILYQRVKWLNRGRFATATTKPEGLVQTERAQVSDSLNSRDDKAGESAEMTDRPN